MEGRTKSMGKNGQQLGRKKKVGKANNWQIATPKINWASKLGATNCLSRLVTKRAIQV
jgi:hypothetical protein